MSPEAYDRWENVLWVLNDCLPTEFNTFLDITLYAREGWTTDAAVQQFRKRTAVGCKEFKGPLLVISVNNDQVVPHEDVQSAVDDTCSELKRERWHESIKLATYEDQNHFSAVETSQLQWLDWIKSRIA